MAVGNVNPLNNLSSCKINTASKKYENISAQAGAKVLLSSEKQKLYFKERTNFF